MPGPLKDVEQKVGLNAQAYHQESWKVVADNVAMGDSFRDVAEQAARLENALGILGTRSREVFAGASDALGKVNEIGTALGALADREVTIRVRYVTEGDAGSAGIAASLGGAGSTETLQVLRNTSASVDQVSASLGRMEEHLASIKRDTADSSADLMQQTEMLRSNAGAQDIVTEALTRRGAAARDAAAAVRDAALADALSGTRPANAGMWSTTTSDATAALIARNLVRQGGTTSNTGDPAVAAALGALLGGAGSGGGGGGGGGGFLGGALGGLGGGGGSTATGQWTAAAGFIARWYPRIHWAMMGINEVLATAGPAAVAAMSAGAVGLEGGQTGYQRLVGVNAVGQSIGPSLGTTPGQFLGLGDSLQKAQTKADPMVWQLMGAAINSVKAGTDSATGGLQDFWQMGTNTIAMMDRFGAQVTLDFKHGLGQELAGAVTGGTQDLQQFGDVLGNVGDTFLHVIPSLPGVGSDLLTVLQGATKGLSDVTALGTKTGLLGPVLALEAGSRYGPAIVGGAASLIGRAGAGLSAAGAGGLGGALGTVGHAATAEEAAGLVGVSEGDMIAGTGLAGLLGGMGPLQIGGIAAATYLTAKGIGYQTPEQQKVAGLQSQIGTDSFTSAYSGILSGINQLAPVASQTPPGTVTQALSPVMELGNAIKHGNLVEGVNSIFHLLTDTKPPTAQSVAQSGIMQMTQQYQELLSAGKQIASVFKVSVPEAFTLADQAGLQLSTALGPGGKLSAISLQQVVNTQTGLMHMTGGIGSPVYNAGVNAIQVSQGLAGSQLSTLNTAYDQILQNAAGGTSAATGFSGGLQALQALGGALPSAATVSPAAARKSAASIAKALEGFTSPASQAAWAAFSSTSTSAPGLLQTVETMMDQLRTAQTSGVLSQAQVAGAGAFEARQLLPYAAKSPAALAQLGVMSQELGGPAYQAGESQQKNLAAISGFLDKASTSAKGYTATQNQMAVGMSNVSGLARNFSAVMGTDVANTMAGAAASMPKATAAMSAFAGSIGSKNLDTSALKTVVSTLKGAGESAPSIKLMMGDIATLHGASAGVQASIASQVQQDLAGVTAVPAMEAANALKAGTELGQKIADATKTLLPAAATKPLAAGALHGPGQAGALTVPVTYKPIVEHFTPPAVPKGGTINYDSKVHPPAAPPAPHGGTVNYGSHVQTPVAPPAPAGGTVVYHSVVIGPGPIASGSAVGGGGRMLYGASGMRVPGFGGGDIFHAMLEPGETVFPKEATSDPLTAALGSKYKVPGFQSGGIIGVPSYPGLGVSFRVAMQQVAEELLTDMQQALGSAAGSVRGGMYSGGMYSGSGQAMAGTVAHGTTANPVAVHVASVAPPAVAALGGSSMFPGAAGPMPKAANKVIDAFEETFKNMPGPWNRLASQILTGLLDGVKNSTKETAAMAQALVSKVTTEINYGRSVANTAVAGLNFPGMQVATPTMTAQGQPYQYYTDQANIAAGGQPGSVQEQMSSYLQAEKSFQGDMSKLAKGGLEKRLLSQLYSAGPVQGDAEAQSIMGGQGGIKAANQLYNQINSLATKLGVSAIGNVYGQPATAGLHGKDVKVPVHADTAAAQAQINEIHGKTVTIQVKVDISGAGSGGGGSGGISLSPSQIKSLTNQVQAQLLKQAKRTGKTGLQLQGYGT